MRALVQLVAAIDDAVAAVDDALLHIERPRQLDHLVGCDEGLLALLLVVGEGEGWRGDAAG